MADLQPPGGGGLAGPGWYRDPWGRSAWRWWDGRQWTGWISPPETVGPAVVRRLSPERTPPAPGPREAPARERLPGGAPGATGYGAETPPEATPPAEAVAMPAPARPVPPPARRRLAAELLIVLAVFPLPYVVAALQALVAYLLGEGPGRRIPILFDGHVGAGFPFILFEAALPLAAAALVLYLLSLPGGDGGPRAIGLDRRHLRADLALLFPVFLLCNLLPEVGGGIVLHALGITGPAPATGGLPSYYGVVYVVMAVVAGVVEEIVVLGFLVHRLEQLGLRPLLVVVLAVAVRGSYHLYYGWGVLPILAWATVSVLVYRRFRRLAPFIAVHALWDAGLLLAGHFLAAEIAVLTPLTIAFTALWWRFLPRKALSPSDSASGG